ncbi:MAG: hypothetical protein U0T77_10745 [Chitinophagales bacterium]
MHFDIDPDTLTDEEWAKLYQQYVFVEKLKYKNLQAAYEAALIKVLNQAFGNGNE